MHAHTITQVRVECAEIFVIISMVMALGIMVNTMVMQ